MFKKIMKIAGIVVGAVLVFTGAVIGVMAAMGKFKKKKIYPNRLFFAETEQVVIYDENNDPDKWYSFVVSGENTKSKYSVNQKDCYISFVNSEAASLIELYDKKQNKLEVNESGRFEVECNEPVYYKIKSQESAFVYNGKQFGKVVIHALGEELSMVASSKDLTIWIDRKVDMLQVKGENVDVTPGTEISPFAKQNVVVATTERMYFAYESNPAASLYPTTKTGEFYGEKEVELYYKESSTAPYEKIDMTTDLTKFKGLIGWDENKKQFYFVSSDVSTKGYDFYIATFATYQDKLDYYAMVEANPEDEHSVKERLDHMVVTNVNIRTYDIGVKQVSFGAEDITLDLRNENLVTLTDNVTGATNLRLSMVGSDDRPNTVRLNSIEFIDDESILGLSQSAKVTLTDTQNDDNIVSLKLNEVVVNSGNLMLNGKNYEIKDVVEDGKSISMYGKRLVYLSLETREFVCSNGYLLYDQENNTLSLLAAGTYLGFFVEDETGYSLLDTADERFTYSIEKVAGHSGRWIVKIDEYNKDSKISLKCLAVNSKDAHKFGKIVTSTYRIAVEEIGLYFGENFSFNECVELNTLTLNLTSESAESKTFAEIVSISDNVSYDQCVFVTEKLEGDYAGKYEIEVIESKEFEDGLGNKYVLVGYEHEGNFINSVKAVKQYAGVDTKIYVMQLKNKEIDLSNLQAHAIKDSNPINVAVLFQASNVTIDADIESVHSDDEIYGLYANQEGYTFTVNGTDLTNLLDAGMVMDNFKVYKNSTTILSSSIEIVNWNTTDNKLTINTMDFVDENEYVIIALEFNDAVFKSEPIYLVSIKPEEVNYVYDSSSTTLFAGEVEDYSGETYTLTLNYNDTNKIHVSDEVPAKIILNKTNRKDGAEIDLGFKTDIEAVVQSFNYRSTDEKILSIDDEDNIVANRVGVAYLEVTTQSGYKGYLKIEVVADEGFSFANGVVDNKVEEIIKTSSLSLKAILPYKHGESSIDSLVELDLNKNTITYFAGGSIKNIEYVYDETENKHTYYYGPKANDVKILVATKDEALGWKFERINDVYTDMTIEFNASVPTKAEAVKATLNFLPATSIGFNAEWNNQQVYVNTQILLMEESSDGNFDYKPYFKVKNESGEPIGISNITFDDGSVDGVDKTSCLSGNIFTPNEVGTYIVTFSNNTTREVVVVDNVVAKLSNKDFDSNKEVQFIALYSFDNSFVHGKDTFNDKIVIYPAEKASINESLNDDVEIVDKDNKWLKYSEGKFKTSEIFDLSRNELFETIKLTYNEHKLVVYDTDGKKNDSIEIKITNIYSVEEIGDPMVITSYTEKSVYSMLKITNSSIEVGLVGRENGLTLKEVVILGKVYTASDDNFKINNTFTNDIMKNPIRNLKFVFDGGYYYETEVELTPYLPSKWDGYNIYSGDEGNWKSAFITTNGTPNGSNLYYGYDTNIITDVSVAYPSGYNNEDKIIEFKSDNKYSVKNITITSKKIHLTFTFKYADGATYAETIEVVVSNVLGIASIYPYQGIEVGKPNLITTNASDSKFIGWYNQQTKLAFEPVLVGQTIKLFDDGEYQNRIAITNKNNNLVEDQIGSVYSVSIAARSESLRSYSCEFTDKTTIKFSSNGGLNKGDYGYIVFRIVTGTGSETYYAVQLSYADVTVENNDRVYSAGDNQNFVSDKNLLGQNVLGDFKINGSVLSSGTPSFYLINYDGIYNGYGVDEIAGIEGLTYGKNLTSFTLPELYNYVTLKIALIYHDNAYINAGILTIYVKPSNAPTTSLTYLNENQDGFYKADIDYGTKSYRNPFDETGINMSLYKSQAVIMGTNEERNKISNFVKISETDNTTLLISKDVSVDTTFSVRYYFTNDTTGGDRYVRIVEYTLQKFTPNTEYLQKTVGNFDGTSDFKNVVCLSELIGLEYNRKIAITNDSYDVVLDVSQTSKYYLWNQTSEQYEAKDLTVDGYVITIGGKSAKLLYNDTDKYYFEFDQETKQYSLNFTIRYSDICNPDRLTDTFSRAINIIVKANIEMKLEGVGSTESNRLMTTLIANGVYETEYPSYIEIKRTQIEGSSVYKYSIVGGGFELYTDMNAKLEITFNEISYVKDFGNEEVGDDFKFYFTHARENRPLTMTIKVKEGNAYYCEGNGNNHLTATLYLYVKQTYTDLEVNYAIKGADHEVIENCASTQQIQLETDSGFFANMTGSEEESGSEVKIKNTNRFSLKNGDINIAENESIDLYTLFNNMGFFTAGNPNKLKYYGGDGYSLSGTTLSFDTTSSQKWVEFVFGSDELGDISYNFNLLSSKNGLINAADRINGKQVTYGDNYVSILVNDPSADKAIAKYLVGDANNFETIATIKDGRNTKYYITSLVNTAMTEITNGKLYTTTGDGFEFNIRLVNRELQVSLKRLANTNPVNIKTYTFTLYGDGLVVENYTIVFANYDISFVEDDLITDDSIIKLSEKIDIINIANNQEESLSLAELKSGKYSDKSSGQEYNNISSLASYDKNNHMLTLSLIAGEVSASIDFEIFVGGYSLGTFTYSFSAERNFNFKINTNTITDNSAVTDYLFTDQHVAELDGKNVNVIRDDYSSYKQDGTKTVEYTIAGAKKTYSTDLLLQMVVTKSGSEVIVNNSEMNGYIIVTSSNEDVVVFDETSSSIIFKQDYYDKNPIVLTITVDLSGLGRGVYVFTWNIRPVGFVNMTPKIETVLGNSGAGFKSGTYVDLLSSSATESRGIEFFNTRTNTDTDKTELNYIVIDRINVMSVVNTDHTTGFVGTGNTVTLYDTQNRSDGTQYSVTDNSTPPTSSNYQVDIDGNDELANNVTRSGYLFNTNNVKVKLPLVEQSEANSSTHYVTYRIEITYKINSKNNHTWTQTYDVTYGVYNPVSIKVNANADKIIDVDNNSENKTYDGTNNTILIFDSTDVAGVEQLFDVTTNENLTWTDIGNMYVRLAVNTSLTAEQKNEIYANTLFEGENNFIYYKLNYESGKYTIKLTEPYKDINCLEDFNDDDNKLFTDTGLTKALFNNLLNVDLDLMSEGQFVTGIKAYNGENGFKLYTSNEIKSVAEATGKTTYLFRDLFKQTSYYNENSRKLLDEMVLGVINENSASDNWIFGDNETDSFGAGELVGEITIRLISGQDVETKIYKATYNRSGSDLYNLSRTFYFVGEVTSVIAPNISASQGVTFTETSSEDYTFDGKRFVRYQMDANGEYLERFEIDQNNTENYIPISTSYQIVGDNTIYTAHEIAGYTEAVSVVDGKIYVSKDFLQAYKNMNQDKISITLRFNTNSGTLNNIEFMIEFPLPKTASLVINSAGFDKTEKVVNGINQITLKKDDASTMVDNIDIFELLDVNAYKEVEGKIVLGAKDDEGASYDYSFNRSHITNVRVQDGSGYLTVENLSDADAKAIIDIGKVKEYLQEHLKLDVVVEITYCINGNSSLALTTSVVLTFNK